MAGYLSSLYNYFDPTSVEEILPGKNSKVHVALRTVKVVNVLASNINLVEARKMLKDDFYKSLYTSHNRRYFKCCKHVGCQHQRVVENDGPDNFKVTERGVHSTEEDTALLSKRELVTKIKVQAGNNVSPLLIRDMLSKEAKDAGRVLRQDVPKLRKIYNVMRTTLTGENQALKSNGDLILYLLNRLTRTKAAYDELPNDWTLIYTHFFDGEGIEHSLTPTNDTCRGYCFTSKQMLQFLVIAILSGAAIHLSFDGTYKMLKNNWTLLILSTVEVKFDNGDIVHTCRPLMMMVCKSESEQSCLGCLLSLTYAMHTFKGIGASKWWHLVVSGMSDKTSGIRNAWFHLGSHMHILNCYFHMTKALRKFLTEEEYKYVEADLLLLHKCTSNEHFTFLTALMLQKWIADGQTAVAEYMSQANGYLSTAWCGWYVGALPAPGQGLTNNALESFNQTVKRLAQIHVSLTSFNEQSMPRILRYLYDNAEKDVVLTGISQAVLFSDHPHRIPQDMLKAAVAIVNDTVVMLMKSGNWYVNASKARNDKVPMTQDRIALFNEAIVTTNTAKEYVEKYMSMYTVIKQDATASTPWHYSCQCKAYMTNGKLCSHIIAVMHMDECINLNTMCNQVEGPSKRGRPSKRLAGAQWGVVNLYTADTKAPKKSKTSKPTKKTGKTKATTMSKKLRQRQQIDEVANL
jgi:hypothetical protein